MRDFTAASHLLTLRPGLLRLPSLSSRPALLDAGSLPAASQAGSVKGAFFGSAFCSDQGASWEAWRVGERGPGRGCEAGPVAFCLGGSISDADDPGMCSVTQKPMPRDSPPTAALIYTAVIGYKPL